MERERQIEGERQSGSVKERETDRERERQWECVSERDRDTLRMAN